MADETKQKIYQTFAAVASSLGYSEVHGRIIAVLLAESRPMSLDELARATGYSLSSISISIDLLEIVGMVRKTKKSGDRKVYARFEGDLLEGLKNAFLLKMQKEISSTLIHYGELKKKTKDEKNSRMIRKLEKEIVRLESYIRELAKVRIPK